MPKEQEFARVEKNWKAPDGSTYDLALIVGDQMLCTENEHWGDFLKDDAAKINAAFESRLKAEREKVGARICRACNEIPAQICGPCHESQDRSGGGRT